MAVLVTVPVLRTTYWTTPPAPVCTSLSFLLCPSTWDVIILRKETVKFYHSSVVNQVSTLNVDKPFYGESISGIENQYTPLINLEFSFFYNILKK